MSKKSKKVRADHTADLWREYAKKTWRNENSRIGCKNSYAIAYSKKTINNNLNNMNYEQKQ